MGNNTNAPDDCAAWVAFAAAVLGGSWHAEVNAEHFAAEAAATAGAMLGHYREFRRRLDQRAEADAATEAEALAALARFGAAIVLENYTGAADGFSDAAGAILDRAAFRAGVAPYPDTFKLAPGVAEAADRLGRGGNG